MACLWQHPPASAADHDCAALHWLADQGCWAAACRIAALESEKVSLQEALGSGTAGAAAAEQRGVDEEAMAEALAVAEAAEAQLAERTQQAQQLQQQLVQVTRRLQVRGLLCAAKLRSGRNCNLSWRAACSDDLWEGRKARAHCAGCAACLAEHGGARSTKQAERQRVQQGTMGWEGET